MHGLKKIHLRVSVDVTAETSVAALRQAMADRLGSARQDITFKKGTMPDPDTEKRGRIYWQTLSIKQGKSK